MASSINEGSIYSLVMKDAYRKLASRSIDEIIADCQNWLSTALSSYIYKDSGIVPISELPESYLEWVDSPLTQSIFREQHLIHLRQSSDVLLNQLRITNKIQPPSLENFQKFMAAYVHFITLLNEIENEYIAAGNGTDSVTGFKAHSLLLPEMRRELERTGRKGNPFSVVMLRIDASDTVEEREFKMRALATALNQCLRGFDDVYNVSDTDLIVSLKQSDIKGGIRFVERLKEELRNIQASFLFTSCVAEPDPSSELVKFLENLERDLSQITSHGVGQTVKFEDISPLQRYVATLKE